MLVRVTRAGIDGNRVSAAAIAAAGRSRTPPKGKTMKSTFRAMTLVAVAVALFLVVGAASMATAGSPAKVTINVAALRPGSSNDAQKQFDDNVALFEKQHPNITVKPVEYAWNGATFA